MITQETWHELLDNLYKVGYDGLIADDELLISVDCTPSRTVLEVWRAPQGEHATFALIELDYSLEFDASAVVRLAEGVGELQGDIFQSPLPREGTAEIDGECTILLLTETGARSLIRSIRRGRTARRGRDDD